MADNGFWKTGEDPLKFFKSQKHHISRFLADNEWVTRMTLLRKAS